jgi:hypothetical protein
MAEKFDDLFEDFFNKKKQTTPNLNEELKKIMESIKKFKNVDNEEDFDKVLDTELGEPTIIEEYIEDGFLFRKHIWQTPHGQFVKLVISEAPDSNVETNKTGNKTLQQQLEDAVAVEDYALAIKLRDKIKAGGDKV